jgi:DNA-binding MarR family transcriptional regulator
VAGQLIGTLEGKLNTEVGDLLRRAAAAHRLRTERGLAAYGLTAGQFAVLAIVVDRPGLSGADIAREEGLTPQTVSVILANLIKNGAVARIQHAVHGRIQQIEATAAGLALFKGCAELMERLEQRLRVELPHEERQTVRHWLRAVASP